MAGEIMNQLKENIGNGAKTEEIWSTVLYGVVHYHADLHQTIFLEEISTLK